MPRVNGYSPGTPSAGRVAVLDVERRVERLDLRCRVRERDVAHLALRVARAPRGHFGAQALELLLAARDRVVGQVAQSTSSRRPRHGRSHRCARAARRRRRTASPSPRFERGQLLVEPRLGRRRRSRAGGAPAARPRPSPARAAGAAAASRSVAARLKIARSGGRGRAITLGDPLALAAPTVRSTGGVHVSGARSPPRAPRAPDSLRRGFAIARSRSTP